MGILSNTVSLSQFFVVGEAPSKDFEDWAAESLAKSGFKSIDELVEERSAGFVTLDDMDDASFESRRAFHRPPYVSFSLRKDERKIPPTLFKHRMEVEVRKWLEEHPDMHRAPKNRRAEIEDLLRKSLLSQTLPAPALADVVWNTEQRVLYLATTSQKEIDYFTDLFSGAFEGLTLAAAHPFARALAVLDEKRKKALVKLNQTGSDNALDLIRENLWIGQDFLLWLVYRSFDLSEYKVGRPGPLDAGTPFTAYVDGRLSLVGGEAEGVQKLTSTGPQADFLEARTALASGKRIAEGTIFMERAEEEIWKLTLKGERFHFGSYRTPKVRLERDELTDAANEREAVFYERMHLVESGLQMLDSLLAEFLKERLGAEWEDRLEEIGKWCESRD